MTGTIKTTCQRAYRTCADPEGGTEGPVFSNSGPDLLNNHEGTEPAFNVGPSNAILMAFRWRADDGLFIVVFVSSHPLIN